MEYEMSKITLRLVVRSESTGNLLIALAQEGVQKLIEEFQWEVDQKVPHNKNKPRKNGAEKPERGGKMDTFFHFLKDGVIYNREDLRDFHKKSGYNGNFSAYINQWVKSKRLVKRRNRYARGTV